MALQIPYARGSAVPANGSLTPLALELSAGQIHRITLRGSTSGDHCVLANRRLIAERMRGVHRFITRHLPQVPVEIAEPDACAPTASPTRLPPNHQRLVEVLIFRDLAPPPIALSPKSPKESL